MAKQPSKAKPPQIGDNNLEGRAAPFVTRIENLLRDLASERGSYMAKCVPIHEDIREVYGEAKENGIAVKALKGLIKWRSLEKKQAAIGDDFADVDEKAVFDHLVEALGPLGFAAAVAAGYRDEPDDGADDTDLRPPFLQANDDAVEERPDAEALSHVGRGDAAAE
jgi:uncharacterized protein (UPF0335 family)